MRREILVPFLGVIISSCSAASAAQFDPTNDIHCAALSKAFRLVSDLPAVPSDQKKAIAFVDDWYGRKLFQLGQSEGEDKVMTEAEAIVKFIESDLPSLKDEYVSCTERAIREAGLSS